MWRNQLSLKRVREEVIILATALPVFVRLYLAAPDQQGKNNTLLLAAVSVVSCVIEKCGLPLSTSLKRNSSAGLFYGLALVPAIMLEITMQPHQSAWSLHFAESICRDQIKVSIWIILFLCCAWRFRHGITVVEHDIQSVAFLVITGLIMHFALRLDICLKVTMHVVISLFSVKMVSSYLPNCFSFGELLLLLNLAMSLLFNYDSLSSYIQVVLVTNWVLFFVCLFLLSLSLPVMIGFAMSSWHFYSSGILLLTCLLYVLFVSLPGGFIMWVLYFISENSPTRQWLLGIWVMEIIACAFYVTRYRSAATKSSTSERKVFHILILLTFVPGLLYDVPMLFFCSVGATCILMILEAIRALDIPPFDKILKERLAIFLDPQDNERVILTPIYLLLGQSLPIWAACLQDPTLLAMNHTLVPIAAYSGVLSVGIGDTAASVVGSRYGHLKWPGTRKTVEGTFSAVIFQWIFIFPLINNYCTNSSLIPTLVASTAASLIEAYTSQIDNIVLPVYLYFLLNVPVQ